MQKSPHPPSPADGQPEKEFTKRVPKRRAVRGDEATVRRTQARGVAPVAWVPAHEASVGVAIRTHAEALPGGAGHPQACAMTHTAIGVVDARHRRADGVDASRVRTRAARHRGRVAVAKVAAPEGAAPTQLARRRRAPTPAVGGLARRHGEVAVVVGALAPAGRTALGRAARGRGGQADATRKVATAARDVGVEVVGACAAVEIARLGGSTSVGARGANTPPEIAPTTRRVGVCVVGPVTAVQVARLRLAARGRHRRALARTEVARTDGLNHGHLKVAGASVAVAWLWGAARHISGIASTSRKVSGTTRNRAEAHELTVAAIDGACLAGAACLIEVQGGRERVSRGHLRWGTVRVKTNRFSRCA